MVTLRFTRMETQILKLAMIELKERNEAVGLPKNDPEEVNIIRKIREGLGQTEEAH